MKPENKEQLKHDEGLRLQKYRDSKGFWTIYYGHLCLDGEVYNNTMEEAEEYLDKDIDIATKDAISVFPEFKSFTENRQDAIIMLLFNLGKTKILHSFPRFTFDVNHQKWDSAANELQYADGKSRLSKWYQDVRVGRAERILTLLRNG